MTIAASFIDEDLPEVLSRARNGRVHSVYRSTLNVSIDAQLVTLATSDVDPGPRTMVLAVAPLPVVLAGESVRVHEGQLIVAGQRVVWDSAARISCVPPPTDPHPATVRVAATVSVEGLRQALRGADAFTRVATERAWSTAAALAQSLRTASRSEIEEFVSALVGLGPGLTPAGDDLLAGILLGTSQAASTSGERRAELADATADCLSQTNEISAAFLVDAIAGKGRRALVRAIAELASPQPRVDRFTDVVRLGHTSGPALLAGTIAGLTGTLPKDQ